MRLRVSQGGVSEVTTSPNRKFSQPVHLLWLQLLLLLATLVAVEVVLVVVHPRYLQIIPWDVQHFDYDAELGWAPIPRVAFDDAKMRPIHLAHNSIGLRDIEFVRGSKPVILALGDSLVYGTNVEAEERFTDLLRRQLPEMAVVNAGVSGYGTDQEYLLLRRLWDSVQPNVVVLMFSVDTDRADNTSSARYDFHYKPYFRLLPNGELRLEGQPVPPSRHVYFNENWIAQHSWLARVAISVTMQVRHGGVSLPDPTERLVDMIRQYVEAHGASFLVGLQSSEPQLEAFLRGQHIPYVAFDGAERYATQGGHWTPKGHALVAERLMTLLTDTGTAQIARGGGRLPRLD